MLPLYMLIFVIVFVALLLIIALMSIGVIVRNKPIAGSCGGVNRLLDERGEATSACAICGKTTACEASADK